MSSMETGYLEEIGLTRSEIKVYLALLELGSSTTGPIVEKSGAASSKIYEVLEKLMKKGLVSVVVKSGTKHYEAAPPENILEILRKREDSIHDQAERVKKLLPQLKMMQAMADTSETTVFKGMKGAETAFRDMLAAPRGSEITIMGLSEAAENYQRFLLRFHQKRSAAGIRVRALFGRQLAGFVEELRKVPHTKVKVYPQGFETQTATFVYGDTTLYSLPKDQLWIRIRNKRLAEANRGHFEHVWNQNVQMLRGDIGVRTLLEEAVKSSGGREIRCLGMQMGVYRYSPALYDWFLARCEEKKIKWRYLCDPEAKPYESKLLARSKGMVELKFLSEEVRSPTVIWIFGDTVATVVWHKEPLVTMISNREIVDHYLKYFEYLWDQDTVTLRGFDGIKRLCDKVVEEGEDMYLIGANMQLLENYPRFFDEFEKRRLAAGIFRHTLGIEEKRHTRFSTVPDAKIRFLPRHFSSPLVIWVFGNFVAQVLWNKPETVFLLENKAVADDYRKYFRLVWAMAKD